jgi:pimeloyl-ACP methyl ester carboxylesterase
MRAAQPGTSGDFVLPLPGGGALGFREYGAPHGRPLLFFHGWPGSSAQAIFLDRFARSHGRRVISVDRPGLGRSTRIPDRNFLHFPPLVDELIERLELGACDVMGMSGGGPYALACAWALPHRVQSAAVCCGAPPLDTPQARRRFWILYRTMLAVHDRFPAVLQSILVPVSLAGRIRPPWPLMRLAALTMGPRDREFLSDRARFDEFYPSFREAMRSGPRALYDDGRCYTEPWPFDVSQIRVPVRIWHGTQDPNFHWSLAEELASRIPGAVFHLREEGHYSLPAFRMDEILTDLQSCKALP